MLIIAHRSGPGIYPEQSILSAREALKNGADMVEMDVRETKDGVPVICHDDDTGRMFGVEGEVKDFTLQQFMAMRHVSDRSFAPHTLEDVGAYFKITRERIRQIEAKAIRKLRHPSRSKLLRDYHNN